MGCGSLASETAIHVEDLPVDELRFGACEKPDGIGDVHGITESSEGGERFPGSCEIGIGGGGSPDPYDSRGDAVDSNAQRAEFKGHDLGE